MEGQLQNRLVGGMETIQPDAGAEDKPNCFERNPGLSCVAEENGALVGAALCGHDGRRGLIYHLGVATSARGRGVGRMLLQHCLNGWRAAGIKRAFILVATDNS
ncbi:MAG: GNAT family N-acetyltransferase, partial [Chthoniobacterales bacterium]|nr:GNAT family N-acetyltransferase [Chthoniobacterales bacterium]